jgi:multimeric flavodoxin WrbA
MSDSNKPDFSGLKALFLNCTLNKSPKISHTDSLINLSKNLMEKNDVKTETVRVVDLDIAYGMQPDMTEDGYDKDDWPELFKKVYGADILVLGSPIWLGDKSSVCTQVVERLYSNSGQLNDEGQYIYYGKVGGCLITGNEDGAKHVAMNVLYSLHHIGYTIPPQVDSTWLGEAGPGPSYGDKLDDGSRAGFDNDFTNKNTTFMTYNLMHMAKMLKDNGGFPVYGNQQSAWNDGNRFGFENPEYR